MTNIKKPHEHADLIKAWADGAEIEYYVNAYNEWRLLTDTPGWHVGHKYRVKPEPVIVEKYHGILADKSCYDVNHTTGYYSAADFVANGVKLRNDNYKLIAIIKTKFVDGVPILVELVK